MSDHFFYVGTKQMVSLDDVLVVARVNGILIGGD